jgi:hypothetical protein
VGNESDFFSTLLECKNAGGRLAELEASHSRRLFFIKEGNSAASRRRKLLVTTDRL